MMIEHQTCNRCVMDTTDQCIVFDSDGNCDHCNLYYELIEPTWDVGDVGNAYLVDTFSKVKESGKGNEFDCIIGMSGGLDSSYLLHKVVTEFGMRPLVFHVDAGWNTEIAVNNIRSLVNKLGLDLYVDVIDWEDMRDFQLALFKSGTPHLDLAQDHAFFSTMYHYATKHNIKYILNGGNHSTECIRNPLSWIYYGTDMSFLHDIRKRFCSRPLENYPWSSIYYHKIYLRYIKNIRVFKPLNFMPYIRKDAIKELECEYGWKPYPQKHFESRFTRFYESFWLPKRFGYDTRRVQFSSLIVTGQMTRQDALKELETCPYDHDYEKNEFEYIANKLGINVDELQSYLKMPKKWYYDYRNEKIIFDLGARVLNFLNRDKALIKR